MGTADIVTKEYMRGNAVFADAFNYLIYNGKKVIDPANLKEIDPTEIALPFDDEAKASTTCRTACRKSGSFKAEMGTIKTTGNGMGKYSFHSGSSSCAAAFV